MSDALKGYIRNKEKLREKYSALVSENPPLDPAQNKEFQGFRQDEDITNSLSQILNQINSGEYKDPEILNLLPNTQEVSDKSLQVQAEVELREHLLEISKASEISKEINEISIQIENLTIRKKGTNAKVQQIEDEICDLNSQLQSKDLRIKELEALLKKSSPAVLSKSIPEILENQVDQSHSEKKNKRSPVKVMNVSKEKRKDESHIKAEQWTQKYQKILKGSGKVINMRAKLPHRRITKQIQGITPRIWKKPPILDQLRSDEKIRKKESKTFGSRSFHSNKFNKKTPVANKFMESAPPVLDLLEHKCNSSSSKDLADREMFRFSLEPREYFDESVNPFKTRNNKGMKTGSKISSIKSQSCSSRRSSIWSQATLQANFEDILEQANELTSTVKFIHLKQNMFKYGTKQVCLLLKSKTIYVRTGGGYIKIKEFLKKNKLIEERKLLGKGATKRLNFVNIPKRAKYSSTTPCNIPPIDINYKDICQTGYPQIVSTFPDEEEC